MRLSRLIALAAVPCFVACVVENVQPPPPPPPAIGPATPTATATAVPTTTATAKATATATTAPTPAPVTDAGPVDATVASDAAPAPPPPPAGDGGADRLHACLLDSDCVAVPRVGCCKNGWKEAVAASQKDAYASSFKCPEANPICAMYIVSDTRVAECNNGTHQCEMVKPEDIRCGGFIRNQHKCADGFTCTRAKNPDAAGACLPVTGADGGH